MKHREHRPDHSSMPQAAARRDQAVAPGKRTLTMGLPSRSADAAPRQRKPAPAPATPARSQAAEGPVEDWMAVAMRPDLHQAPILRKSMNEIGYAGADVPAAAAASSGQRMPAPVQAKMEHAFGADFSGVRIHQGPEAQSMGALAYTQGAAIHFAPGQYDPGSQRGQELLGHELTHVVQQSQGRVRAPAQAKGQSINDDVALEQEADQLGARAARGESVGLATGGSLARPTGGTVQMSPGETIQRIVAALGVATFVATAIYMAVPASVATIITTSGLIGLGEYWAGIVNGVIARCTGSRDDQMPEDLGSEEASGSGSEDELLSDSNEGSKQDKGKELDTGETSSSKGEQSLIEGMLGDCLYTAVNRAFGNAGSNEDAYRRIATTWLLQQGDDHEIFDFGTRDELIDVVSQPGAWTGDAGDLSAVVLAYSLGIRVRIVTAGGAYVFDGGGGPVTIYYDSDHYTSFPVEGVHGESGGEVVAKPSKKIQKSIESRSSGEKDTSTSVKDQPGTSGSTGEGPSRAKRSQEDELSPQYEQALRNILRVLGAQAKLTGADRRIREIIKRALETDRISTADRTLIDKYTRVDRGTHHRRGHHDEPRQEDGEDEAEAFDRVVILSNGTQVDYPALDRVMADVALGVKVAPKVWRAMRQALSKAITLPNKSHPAHGANFNDPQRPEQQIKDWAAPLEGELREALSRYFRARGVDID
jgi:hypothetical protein